MSSRKPIDPGPTRRIHERTGAQMVELRDARRASLERLSAAARAARLAGDRPKPVEAGGVAGLSDGDFSDRMAAVPRVLAIPAAVGGLGAVFMGFSPLWMALAAYVLLGWGTAFRLG